MTQVERIAVVGAGPAGLTATHDLAELGYAVTVIEARRKAGGMLRHAVPDFRLSPEVIDWETARVLAGVEFRPGKALGKDFAIDDLFAEGFEAVLLTLGAGRLMPAPLDQPARQENLLDALSFLLDVKAGKGCCPGREVVVLGAGHLALDAARCALRLGAERVLIPYPRERQDFPMPDEEVDAALAEGVSLLCGWRPVEVLRIGKDVFGVRCRGSGPGDLDGMGRRRVVSSAFSDREQILRCDRVISAFGHQPDARCLAGERGLRRGVLDNLLIDPLTQATGRKGVFAAGDLVTAGATVIDAIAAGQRVAMAIHRYLRGEPANARFKLPRPRRRVPAQERDETLGTAKPAVESLLPVDRRRICFEEVVGTLSCEAAVGEAGRCLRCDLG